MKSSFAELKVVKDKGSIRMRRLWKNTCGQDMIEYALVAGFIVFAIVAGVTGVSDSITSIFTQVSANLTLAAGDPTSPATPPASPPAAPPVTPPANPPAPPDHPFRDHHGDN